MSSRINDYLKSLKEHKKSFDVDRLPENIENELMKLFETIPVVDVKAKDLEDWD